uniref:Uncharacterized protein n=1 Tax=uncultured bacterium A1Q1_fos_515 TaxID=1256581 RepID=L7VQS3_9BACT|nr:hypothetical protein [uncultured bacterium A1Q1_fos_515]
MRTSSTSVRSAGHTGPPATSAGTSPDSTHAQASTEGLTIVGLRSGTALDPKLVAEFRSVAARTDIAQRVLTILEPGEGPKSPDAAGRSEGPAGHEPAPVTREEALVA